jgi:hypothetical protein
MCEVIMPYQIALRKEGKKLDLVGFEPTSRPQSMLSDRILPLNYKPK